MLYIIHHRNNKVQGNAFAHNLIAALMLSARYKLNGWQVTLLTFSKNSNGISLKEVF